MENNIKAKELPLVIPDIKTNPFITDRLAIILAHENTEEWFMSKFYNFWVCKNVKEHEDYWGDLLYHSAYRFCPFLTEGLVSKTFINSKWKGNILEFLMDTIDSGQYAYMNINCSIIPDYLCRLESNEIHDTMVFGYDREEKVVFTVDFFAGDYRIEKISFDMFEEAYQKLSLSSKEDFINGICVLEYKECNERFDIEQCIRELKDYVESQNTQIKSILTELDNEEEVCFGLECYDGFIKYLDEVSHTLEEVDYRQFHFFYVLKMIMTKRIHFLLERGFLSEECTDILGAYRNIEDLWLEIRNAVLMYNMRRKETFFQWIIKKLEDTKREEEKVLRKLLDMLQSRFDKREVSCDNE